MDAGIIERSAQALRDASPPGSCVVLFGSRARGTDRADSDVDFLVIQPEVTSRISEAARLARVLRPLRIAADILVVSKATYEEWKDTPNSVFYEAARYGRVLA